MAQVVDGKSTEDFEKEFATTKEEVQQLYEMLTVKGRTGSREHCDHCFTISFSECSDNDECHENEPRNMCR